MEGRGRTVPYKTGAAGYCKRSCGLPLLARDSTRPGKDHDSEVWNGISIESFYLKPSGRKYLFAEVNEPCDRFSCLLDRLHPDIVKFNHLANHTFDIVALAAACGSRLEYFGHDYWPVCPLFHRLKPNDDLCYKQGHFKCLVCCYPSFHRWRQYEKNGILWPIKNGIKFIINLPYEIKQILFILHRRERIRQTFRLFKLMYAPSRQLTNNLTEEFKDTEIVYKPHNIKQVAVSKRKKDGIIRFGFVGHCAHHKGFDILVKALNELNDKNQSGYLVNIYGSIQERYQRVIINKNVKIHGAVGHDILDHEYEQMDYLLFPTLCFETGPLVVIEALAHGVKIITAKYGAMAEVVPNDRGIFIQRNDANDLNKVMADIIVGKAI